MSEFTPLIPPIQIDATSYAADDVDREEDLLVAPDESQRPAAAMARPSPLAPLDPPLTPQGGAPPVAQAAIPQPRRTRRRSKARALFDRIAQRHNEFWELFLGPFAGAGWLVSLFMHAAAVTALAFILVGRNPKEAPHIIIGTESTATESGVGDLVSEISIENERVPQESASALLANGGSTGQLAPDFAAAFGAPVGKGQGQGRGGGDGMGDEIAGRVRAAGGKAGNLQISLAWNDRNDLDLHLVTPDGRRLFYATPRSEDGGTLDVDMNVNAESTTPVENITWGAATPSDGEYLVQVHLFARHTRHARSPFSVRLQVGDDVRVISGDAVPGRILQVVTFRIESSRCVALEVNMKERDESEVQVTAVDSKRAEARERSAVEALSEARASDDPQLKAGKLRLVIRRFPGTNAATEAQQLLESLAF